MPVVSITFKDIRGKVHTITSDDGDQVREYIREQYPEGYSIIKVEKGWESIDE